MSKPETKNEEIKQLVLTTDPDNVSKELLNKFAGITSLDLSYSDFKNIDILVNLRNLRNLQIYVLIINLKFPKILRGSY